MEFVYVKTNADGHIVAVNSSAFLRSTDGWVKIDEGCGDRYYHAQGNYFPDTILTENGAYRYKLVDGAVQCRTENELEADTQQAAAVPSQLDRIEAQVVYTAMMTDTLLEV